LKIYIFIQFVDRVRKINGAFPLKTLIAGSVVTSEMLDEQLDLSEADIVKVCQSVLSC
jgi:hypothetical protein